MLRKPLFNTVRTLSHFNAVCWNLWIWLPEVPEIQELHSAANSTCTLYIYDVYTIPISAEDLLLYKLMDSRAPLISKKHNRGLVQGTIQKSKSIATHGFWGVPNHV